MIARSDQSAMPLWPWWGWALVLAVALFLVVVLHVHEHRRYRRVMADQPINLWPVCPTRGCRYPARRKVESFTGVITVCHGCADEGIAHGWFTTA